MDFDPSEHPHRRYNPLTGEYVLVSPHRTKRPWQGQIEPTLRDRLPHHDAHCYLCPGNARSGGQINPQYEKTFVFPNDFAAFLPERDVISVPPLHPLLRSDPVHGYCDVLVFHPRHDLTMAQLSDSDILDVIEEWVHVYKIRSACEGIKYIQIFENKGAMMGCSNPHPHGQAWSLSIIPGIPANELAHMKEYADSQQQYQSEAPLSTNSRPNLLLEYAHTELAVKENERVVISNEDWVALVPWWAVWPFEILVIPYRRQILSLAHLHTSEKKTFASILSKVTVRYDNLFATSFAYSMGIHQLPVFGAEAEYPDAQLHVHFAPPLLRNASVRKFLVGFELMSEPQRDLTPEQAAARLREVSSVHYLARSS